MPTLEVGPVDRNGVEFTYTTFHAQGTNQAFDRLTPVVPRDGLGIINPNDAIEVIDHLEKHRISDLFKIFISANRIHVLKTPEDSPPGTIQFAADQATVVSQDSLARDVPRVGSYRAVVTLVPRDDRKTWVGARVLKKAERGADKFDISMLDYCASEIEGNESEMKRIEQMATIEVSVDHF